MIPNFQYNNPPRGGGAPAGRSGRSPFSSHKGSSHSPTKGRPTPTRDTPETGPPAGLSVGTNNPRRNHRGPIFQETTPGRPPGPSKNELKVRRRRADANEAAQQRPLSEEIPGVQRVTLQLDFLTPQRQVLDQQTHVFNAADTADFTAECLGRCGGTGIFDLSEKVQQAVNARQRTLQSTDLCAERISPGSSETCGFQLQSTIDVVYAPAG